MATGLALPPGVDASGRARTVTGKEQTKKVVQLNCTDGESTNPFQDLGIGKELIFAIDEVPARGRASGRITAVMARLEAQQRAKLAKTVSVDGKDGVLTADFDYIDLETDASEKTSISQRLGPGSYPSAR